MIVGNGTTPPWLEVVRGAAPLLVCMPHTGTELSAALVPQLASVWRARKDTDWWIERAVRVRRRALGATVVRSAMSRTVIDPNRDPSGASLYPGQASTELCPTTTFDGEPLYQGSAAPRPRRSPRAARSTSSPYHHAVSAELARLRRAHPVVVLYDCHSIRSQIPRLFAGLLPQLQHRHQLGQPAARRRSPRVSRRCATRRISRG